MGTVNKDNKRIKIASFFSKNNWVRSYYFKFFLFIGLIWSLFDNYRYLFLSTYEDDKDFPFSHDLWIITVIRLVSSFIFYTGLAYIIVIWLRNILRSYPMWINFIIKIIFLTIATVFYISCFFFFTYIVILDYSTGNSFKLYSHYIFETTWIINFISSRILLFIITLLLIELTEKYSPGVFAKIFLGRYFNSREEMRLVMFIDLKDSTPIAEKLGHKIYFQFIRDFIYDVSVALLEHDGFIYQYVGDEIVVSWILSEKNKTKSIQSMRKIRYVLAKESKHYMRKYGIVPEYRVGAHVGVLTVGEIGVVKKDLALSGDTMNTAARIRSVAGELNEQFLVSADFVQVTGLDTKKIEDKGSIELKGKTEPMQLYAIKF